MPLCLSGCGRDVAHLSALCSECYDEREAALRHFPDTCLKDGHSVAHYIARKHEYHRVMDGLNRQNEGREPDDFRDFADEEHAEKIAYAVSCPVCFNAENEKAANVQEWARVNYKEIHAALERINVWSHMLPQDSAESVRDLLSKLKTEGD